MKIVAGVGLVLVVAYVIYFVVATLVILGAWNLALVPLLNFPAIDAITAFGVALVIRIIASIFAH